jgi:hypothetical protein
MREGVIAMSRRELERLEVVQRVAGRRNARGEGAESAVIGSAGES